jgi:hypothetical protein
MIRAEVEQPHGCGRRDSSSIFSGLSVMLSCVSSCLLTTTAGVELSSGEILAKVAETCFKPHAVAYSGLREYRLHNFRFDKQATVTVQVTYRSAEGMKYTVLESRGSTKLTEIVEKLLASEADVSRPSKLADYEISAVNYDACFRGTETAAGRTHYIIDLVPKHKSKYLIRGRAWVDRSSYTVARLEGVTAASVSMWVGAPHIEQEFKEIDGVWLPIHTAAVSSGLFLGTSELEIRYTDYLIADPDHPVPSGTVNSVQSARP